MNQEQSRKVNEEYARKASRMTVDDMNDVAGKKDKVWKLLGKLGSKAADIKLLWNMMIDYKEGRYPNVPWRLIGSIVFAFVYLLMPVDVIPDIIPILGFTDDIAVFGLVLKSFEHDIETYKAWREEHRDDGMRRIN